MPAYVLDPIPYVTQGAFRVLAFSAYRDGADLHANVQIANQDDLLWSDDVVISSEAGRQRAASVASPAARLSADALAGSLLALYALVEGAVRHLAEEPEWREPLPLETATPPPFPVEALVSPTLVAMAREIAGAYNAPVDFGAMGILAALSGAIGNRARIHISGDIYASACLWAVIVGPPGIGKSEPLERALAPLTERHARLLEDYQRAKEDYERDLERWETTSKGERGEKPQPPSPKRLLVSDQTMESLTADLAANPWGLLLYRDELAAMLASFDRYRASGGGGDRATFLEMWSGKALDVGRKTGNRVTYVPRPFLSIIGGIQPERLTELLGSMDDGFPDRLLAVCPQAAITGLPKCGVDRGLALAYSDLVWRVLDRAPEDGQPALARLTVEALARYEVQNDAFTDLMREEGLAPTVVGALAKLRIYASRLTLILHQAGVAEGTAEPGRVGPRYVEAAWRIVRYLAGHTRILHAAKVADPEAARALRTLETIERKGWATFSRRDLYQAMRGRFSRPSDAERALALLCEHDYVRERPGETRAGRGRPRTPVYDVNPHARERGDPAGPPPAPGAAPARAADGGVPRLDTPEWLRAIPF